MFTCKSCQYSSSTKLGKCPMCGEFGTFEIDENLIKYEKKSKHKLSDGNILLEKNIKSRSSTFFAIENKEFLRVFSNGIKKGGIYLLGGAPGIGKSTLILQIIQALLYKNNIDIAYFSGEEQEDQIIARWDRISQNPEQQKTSKLFSIFHSTHLEDIISTTKENQYNLIIIDSIQTIYSSKTESSAGSPNQVKYCAEKLSEFCKENQITIIIIGHVTKDGEIAGPKYLEHIVDVVLYLEGDKFGQLRFLRSQKNRFGNTDDSAIFEMTLFGLQAVYDLKDRILKSANTETPGSVLTIGLDNGRPVLTNVEVLLNKTKYKFPTRNCIGLSSKRVDLVIAILERYLKIDLSIFDIFVNVPNEFDFQDSGLDLAVAIAILSQYRNQKIQQNIIFIGELGLGGQLLKTKLHNKRIKEIPEGFEKIDLESTKNIVEIKKFF